MKTIILGGGTGPGLSEETGLKPKPRLEIGEHPILWHIMQIYAFHGFSEFLVALGFRRRDDDRVRPFSHCSPFLRRQFMDR